MTDVDKRENAIQATVKMWGELEKCRWLTDEAWKAVVECISALAVFLPQENV